MSDFHELKVVRARTAHRVIGLMCFSLLFANLAGAADLPRRVPGAYQPNFDQEFSDAQSVNDDPSLKAVVQGIEKARADRTSTFANFKKMRNESVALRWYQANCSTTSSSADCQQVETYFRSSHEKLMAKTLGPMGTTPANPDWDYLKKHTVDEKIAAPSLPTPAQGNTPPTSGQGTQTPGGGMANSGGSSGGSSGPGIIPPVSGGGTSGPTKPSSGGSTSANNSTSGLREDIPKSARSGNDKLVMGGNDNGNSQTTYGNNPRSGILLTTLATGLAEEVFGPGTKEKLKADISKSATTSAPSSALSSAKEALESEALHSSSLPSSGNAMAGACRSQSVQAARACQQALQNTQTLAGKVQLYNLNLQNQSQSGAGACGQMGEMASQAAQQMAQEKANCNGLVAACNSACATALAQLGNESNAASTEASAGQALCASAEASISTMAMNVSQMQSAASQAQQCYSDITGQGLPKNGAAGHANAAISGGTGLGEMSKVTGGSIPSACPAGSETCGAEAPAGPGTNILLSDDSEGGGAPSQSRGGGYPELPADSNRLGALPMSPHQQASTSNPNVNSQANRNPVTNQKMGMAPTRDHEAERRSRAYSNLPQLTGYHDVNGFHVTMAEPQKNERRPASQVMIGGKHTNIFTTVSQRYGRKANTLSP